MKKLQKMFLIIGIVLLFFIPVWIFLIVPQVEKIPADFSFKVDFLFLDNTYNPEKNAFEGERIAKASLDVHVNSIQGNSLLLYSVFHAQTLTGNTIYKNERQYTIDVITGKGVSNYRTQDQREQWVILPKHMENKSYLYSYYVRVDPVKITFLGEENILGLTVYHYRGFDSVDASKIFSFIEGVPEERGVTNEVQADIWVEPISGHLVNVIDKGKNTYHDPTTGQKLDPWNTYYNAFNDETIAKQVRIAQYKKQQIILYEIIIPVLLAIIAIALLIVSYMGGLKKDT